MVAAAFIDAHFEPRPSGDESEQCAYRAERVAIGAAETPGNILGTLKGFFRKK